MPDLKKLCESFYDRHLNKKCIICKINKFRAIDECCDKRVEKMKREMYPNYIEKDVCLLDRHKIIAAHIQCFLRNPIFIKVKSVTEESAIDLLANEYYCYLALQAIIIGWPGNKISGKELDIPEYYKDCLLKLFYKYRNSSVLNLEDTTFSYALASIVYFVERCFLV